MGTDGSIPTWDLQDRLTKALRHAHVSKDDIADYLGVNVNTVNNYLAGRTRIPHGSVRLWAQRTGVDLAWLAGDEYATRRIRVRRTGHNPSSTEPPCVSDAT